MEVLQTGRAAQALPSSPASTRSDVAYTELQLRPCDFLPELRSLGARTRLAVLSERRSGIKSDVLLGGASNSFFVEATFLAAEQRGARFCERDGTEALRYPSDLVQVSTSCL